MHLLILLKLCLRIFLKNGEKKTNHVFIERLLFLIIPITIRMVIQIWNTLNSAMGLQYQAFKKCEKWMLPYKERGSNLDKRLSAYLNIIHERPIKYPIKYPLYLQDQGKCPSVKLPLIFWFLIMAFNLGYDLHHVYMV